MVPDICRIPAPLCPGPGCSSHLVSRPWAHLSPPWSPWFTFAGSLPWSLHLLRPLHLRSFLRLVTRGMVVPEVQLFPPYNGAFRRDASYIPDPILRSPRDRARSGGRSRTGGAGALPLPASPVTSGQRLLRLDTRHVVLSSRPGKKASLLAAPGPPPPAAANRQLGRSGRAPEAQSGLKCAPGRPARAGERPGGKCEFLPVCLTAIKAAAGAEPPLGCAPPGNPLSWMLFEVGEGGGAGEEGKGRGRPGRSLCTHAAPARTAHLAPSALRSARPFLWEDNLLTRSQVGHLVPVPLTLQRPPGQPTAQSGFGGRTTPRPLEPLHNVGRLVGRGRAAEHGAGWPLST